MNTPYSRAIGISAYLFSLAYIYWQVDNVDSTHVLIYLASLIAYWLLGRNTIVEVIKIIWDKKNV